eukprot:TRINITY_DN3204_c0_g2_i2.p1 TRINITY_DN3204_c0_g2~~TRINITY_DN3204_c0_g2_i2.p1  ORF type:complete len:642 (-),score=144.96 TRINITY_DN3204_c0_g2_i2:212-2137(-)
MDPSTSTPPPTPTKQDSSYLHPPATSLSDLLPTKGEDENQGCCGSGFKRLQKKYDFPNPAHIPRSPSALGRLIWDEFKLNWKAGVTVALVSVPLSISLAIAAEAPPIMGIVTAIWAGGIAAAFGGSHYNIMGPTGALSGILAMYATMFGENILPFLSVLTGVICLVVFLLRVDSYFMFIPSAVVHGFTLGVAFIIALNQLNFALGLRNLERHEHFYQNVWNSLMHIPQANPWAFIVFLIGIVGLMTLVRKLPKFPWVIILALIGIAIGFFLEKKPDFPIKLLTLHALYGDLTLHLFNIPDIRREYFDFSVFTAAFSVAFIAILETLISAKIADRMTNTSFSQPREVMGVGLANLACGIFGGVPATAALARTALNVKSGATSRAAGIINALSIIVISFVLLPAFKYLIMPIVASILVQVAIRMVEFEHITHMWKHDKKMFILCIFTCLVCIFLEPTSGIVYGAIIGLLIFASNNAVGHGELAIQKGKKYVTSIAATTLDEDGAEALTALKGDSAIGDTLVYRIPGDLTYLNAPSHIDRSKKIPDRYKTVILSLRHLFYLDLDGLDALSDMVSIWEMEKRRVIIAGVNESCKDMLHHCKWYKDKEATGLAFPSYREALAYLTDTESNRGEDFKSYTYYEEMES